jgi:hypothetical protein
MAAALMPPDRRVGRCARSLTHARSALALVLAAALRSDGLSAAEHGPLMARPGDGR